MNTTEKIKSALRRLQLSDNEQTVYLSLLTEGQATARTLASRTGITRPSIYDQIKSLRQLGIVHELDIEGKAHFAAAAIKHLEALLDDQIDRLEQSRDFLKTFLPSLGDSLQTTDPKIRFFEGSEGVKQLLKDIMWHDNQTLSIIWATSSMDQVFDQAFLKWFDERRAKRNLVIHSLATAQTSLFLKLPNDQQLLLKSKSLPDMTTIIYGNKVAQISSQVEAFGFIVESSEYAALQKLQFEALLKIK
ncbi:MAG: sugar-specific transcriptional regulator TrmB [Candidatus Paceibacteria bacterium]|jgi:sugar-specific transcriptional regulator TrmB